MILQALDNLSARHVTVEERPQAPLPFLPTDAGVLLLVLQVVQCHPIVEKPFLVPFEANLLLRGYDSDAARTELLNLQSLSSAAPETL